MSVEAELLAVSAAWDAALVANDSEAVAAFMSDDWVYVGPTGPTPKADVIGAIATGRLAHHSMQSTGAWDGRTYAADEWISEVYVRRNGRWLCVLSQKCAAEG